MANYDYAVLVTGTGDTTRANVEALLEDYILSKDGKGVLILAFSSKPSAAQIWAGQMSTQHGLDAVIVSSPNGLLDSVPKGSFVESTPGNEMAIGVSVLRSMSEDASAFIVWSDEDTESAQTLAECKQHKVLAYDLTNGLCSIIPAETIDNLSSLVPAMPVAEMLNRPEVVEDAPDTEEVVEDSEEDEEEGEDLAEVFYGAIYAFAELVAEIVAEKIKAEK